MPGRIQTLPRGFLAALGLKSSGQNPAEVLDEVRPTFEMDSLYLQQFTKGELQAAAVTTGVGDSVDIFVPQGKVWIPIAAHHGFVNTGGNISSTSISVLSVQIGGIAIAISDLVLETTLGASGQSHLRGVVFPDRFALPPGTRFRAEVTDISGLVTPVNIQLAIGYYELEV